MVVNETTDAEPTGPTAPGIAPDAEPLPTRLLVFGMAHPDGSIHNSELNSVLELCGLSVDQVRSQMRRLVSEGLFTRDGEGKDTIYRATPAGQDVLTANSTRHTLAYAQDAAGTGWDRTWRIVAFNIPEAQRAARDALRDTLLSLGAAPLQGGVYISPHRWDEQVHHAVDRLGVGAHVTIATTDDLEFAGERDPRRIAALVWPLDEIARYYEEFIEHYSGVPELLEGWRRDGRRIEEKDWLPGALLMAARFNQSFGIDPLLPPELLPRPWPGRAARQVLARCRILGVQTRADRGGPALFRVFDEAISGLP
jgi:phenylacetic acid degradation operon negative regulatory protein